MTGKGQLRGGREDAHASIAAVLGRKQEDGLGQIHLPGQALHLVVAERRPVFEHRQLVPLQWRVSKYIDDYVGQGHSISVLFIRLCKPGTFPVFTAIRSPKEEPRASRCTQPGLSRARLSPAPTRPLRRPAAKVSTYSNQQRLTAHETGSAGIHDLLRRTNPNPLTATITYTGLGRPLPARSRCAWRGRPPAGRSAELARC